jgi:uncharacterized protein
MHQKLPVEIDPFRLAKSGLILEGKLPLVSMPRLSNSLQDSSGHVDVKMSFDVDKILGSPIMIGEFKAQLPLLCERCSEPMLFEANIKSSLAIINSERKIEGLDGLYEPWIITSDDPVILSSIVEDELILAIPLVPKHEHACLPKEAWFSGEEQIDDEKPISPFAVLSALKKD